MNTKKQQRITISFDEADSDIYFELMRQSTRKLIPVSPLVRHYIKKGMNNEHKQPALVWYETEDTDRSIYLSLFE